MRGPHLFTLRVYYEDADLAGIVYYANYLKFIERVRNEWVRDLGVDQSRLRAEQGLVFGVRRVEADYLRPARFDDELTVQTALYDRIGARLILDQRVFCGITTFCGPCDSGLPDDGGRSDEVACCPAGRALTRRSQKEL